MADNDKTIANLAKLAIGENFDKERYVHDLYLVSHPLNQLSSTPSDYITYNISLVDLAKLILSTAYDRLLDQVSTDLSLGELAHCDALTASKHAGENIIRLDLNVDGSTYGPLALPTKQIKKINDNNDLCANLGLGDLAFKDEVDLDLKDLAHKSYITSADVETGAQFPSVQIAVPFKNLCLSDESMLKLSALAHQDVVYPYQIVDGISVSQLLSDDPAGWKPVFDQHYISVATSQSRGSIAVGFEDKNVDRLYGVKLNGDNAYVNVPWTNTSEEVRYTLSASTASANTIVLTQNIKQIVDGDITANNTIATPVTLTPTIPNNVVQTGPNVTSPRVAIFAGNNLISGGAELDLTNGENKVYKANGTFQTLDLATSQTSGLMSKNDYNYLYSLTSNLPLARSDLRGAIKIGCIETNDKLPVKLDDEKAYVQTPRASATKLGCIQTGASRGNGQLPVEVDNFGNAFVKLFDSSSGSSDVLAGILDILYPKGAIYMTAQANCTVCPLEGIAGSHWTQIIGRYIFASGTLINREVYGPGTNIDAGLPSHTHGFSFCFSASSSTSGYPHHGSGSACAHGSYDFTTGGASNSIYGSSATVRPKGYAVAVFQRVS